jgi:hypothetical protein
VLAVGHGMQSILTGKKPTINDSTPAMVESANARQVTLSEGTRMTTVYDNDPVKVYLSEVAKAASSRWGHRDVKLSWNIEKRAYTVYISYSPGF